VTYLLDPNAVVAVLRNQPAGVRERLRRIKAEGAALAVSSVALFDLWYGVARSQHREKNMERLRLFLSGDIGVVEFGEHDVPIAGDLRRALEAARTSIGAYDLLIAAQALRTCATLVTANVAEFAEVRGLAWEGWTAAP
jgi:tRNA(fMet)-specific endonuclease VapC